MKKGDIYYSLKDDRDHLLIVEPSVKQKSRYPIYTQSYLGFNPSEEQRNILMYYEEFEYDSPVKYYRKGRIQTFRLADFQAVVDTMPYTKNYREYREFKWKELSFLDRIYHRLQFKWTQARVFASIKGKIGWD